MAMQRTLQGVLLTVAAIVALFFGGRALVYLTGDNPIIGSFTAEAPRGGCPQTDNCVSTYVTENPWVITPIACDAGPSVALAATHDAIIQLGNVEVVSEGASYVVRSRLMRFPDDVRVAASSRGIEVLSSSRLGAGDLGINRARVERLRTALESDPRC